MTLPAGVELCARVRDGGRVHRPLPTTTYCTRCGATDGPTARYTLVPTARYTLAPRGALAPEPAA